MRKLYPLVLCVVACANEVTRPGADFEAEDRGPGPSGSPSLGPSGMPLVCTPGVDRARRLSNDELENSLTDLFPNTPLPPVAFPVPGAPNGFNNDAELLRVDQAFFDTLLSLLEEFAPAIAEEAISAAGCSEADALSECASKLVDYWSLRILRRPVPDSERSEFQTLMVSAENRQDGAALALQAMFMSPEFIYRIESPGPETDEPGVYEADDFTLAERLAYLIWAGPPDDALLALALSGELSDVDTLRSQAERMAADPRARRPIRAFFRQWLEVEHIDDALKNEDAGLDEALRDAMKEQTMRTVEYLVFEEGATVQELLTRNDTFVNAELAKLYGMDPVEGWTQVSMDATERRGLLTHASFLAAFGHPNYPSPVLRGVYVLENILCASPGEPPPAAQDNSPDEGGDTSIVTNRDRFEAATMLQGASCTTCHQFINPIGHSFEVFDTMGRWQSTDNGVPVDASGSYGGVSFDNALELIDELAGRAEVQECVTRRYLTFALAGQDVSRSDCLSARMDQFVIDAGGAMSELFTGLVVQPEFRTLRTTQPEG